VPPRKDPLAPCWDFLCQCKCRHKSVPHWCAHIPLRLQSDKHSSIPASFRPVRHSCIPDMTSLMHPPFDDAMLAFCIYIDLSPTFLFCPGCPAAFTSHVSTEPSPHGSFWYISWEPPLTDAKDQTNNAHGLPSLGQMLEGGIALKNHAFAVPCISRISRSGREYMQLSRPFFLRNAQI